MVFLLLVAGHETTVNLIGNGAHALLTHPDQLALVRAEPERLPAVIEELLRFDGPVQVATFRWTTAPVTIGGTVIPAGELVIPGLLAANRDPARIANPTRSTRPAPRSPTSRSATACTTASVRAGPARRPDRPGQPARPHPRPVSRRT